ncbi:hypothetical protein G6F38_009848 [Rhizopus arrhizus]|nr:hypothetical protein G6F38_009848 [Rhizopus arrhizus]
MKRYSSNQRLAQEYEACCVVCGRYGEYVNKDTKQDVCSVECKNINTDLNQHRINSKSKSIPTIKEMHNYMADNLHAKLTHYQEPASIASTSKSQIRYMMKAHSLEVSGSQVPKPLTTFDQLSDLLGPTLLQNIESLGWTSATGIQRQAITAALAGRDVIGWAPKNSGKTGAFLIPTLVHCRSMSAWYSDKRRAGPYALILAPTREICCELETVCQRLAVGMKNMRTALLIGGEPLPNQLYRLKKGVQILIGTPGRLLDLAADHPKLLRLWQVQMIVMDEADTIFQSGYGVQVRQILGKIKDDRNRQFMYFSSNTAEEENDVLKKLAGNNQFVNPFEEWIEIPFYKTLLFWIKRYKGNGIPFNENELHSSLPTKRPLLETLFNQPADKITFTWFGQSTCLITIDGLTILTDPVFSKRSINDYLGPKRLRPIPCQLEEFQDKVDIVLVSHDHFDHLDENVVNKLNNSVTWYIPLGLGNWFLKRKIMNFVELDWWQKAHFKDNLLITCVPAMHWSGSRRPFEKNKTLWCSFVIKSKRHSIFFCGDTGYSPELFQAIGHLYAPFTLAALPIGSYLPFKLMKHLHMGPQDAIQVHRDLRNPRLSVGIHWGTFMMSDEHYLSPKQILDTSFEQTEDSQFITTAFGETIVIPKGDLLN